LSAVVDPAWNDAARVARSFTAGKGQGTTLANWTTTSFVRERHKKAPDDAGAFE